jgi:hypothetical protein
MMIRLTLVNHILANQKKKNQMGYFSSFFLRGSQNTYNFATKILLFTILLYHNMRKLHLT